MALYPISPAYTPHAIAAVQQVEAPKPPKSQSDHKPVNPPTSSRGPAVVLSGALAKPVERQGQQAQTVAPPTGQHINHVI
jgi:hypothetical protein